MRMYWRMLFQTLFGCSGLGEYWGLISDTDPKYKDADSIVLLKEVRFNSKQRVQIIEFGCCYWQMPKFNHDISFPES